MMRCEERLLRFTRNDNKHSFCHSERSEESCLGPCNTERLLRRFTPRNDQSVPALFLVSVLFLIFLLSTALDAAEVKNIKPSQVGNRILFEFDVEGNADEETDVNITLTINGKTYSSDNLHLEGDFGKTRAGKGKKIWWNVLQDFSRGLSQNFDVEIVAWYSSNSGSKTHPVGQKKPNGLGIYDMSGNVWEWVNDWYGGGYYKNSPKNNPKGPNSGSTRVLRGGSWLYDAWVTRTANRNWNYPVDRSGYNGFRLARTP